MTQDEHVVPFVPNGVPKDGNRFSRWLGKTILRLSGWRIVGELPRDPKLIIAAAPHTSNWDFILFLVGKLALGIHFSYLMKREAFFWPFKNLFIRMGGVPVNRSRSGNIVDQVVSWIESRDQIWVGVTPEGTRSKVGRWKTGFLRMAEKANIPVYLVCWDYPSKTMRFLKRWETTGDHEADVEAIRAYLLSNFQGKHPEKQ